MTKHLTKLIVAALLVALAGVVPVTAQDVEIRFMCYQDGGECEVYDDLLTRFEEDNPGIDVIVDIVPYATVRDELITIVEAGEAPDMARITNFAGMAGSYLDLRPLLSDPAMLEDNFNPAVLAAFREEGDDTGLYGFPDALTVTAPYVNATLFEQAGVEIPGEGTTWEEWTEVLTEVAEVTGTDYAVAIDNKGHRFAGPAMSMGATFFDDEGNFDLAGDEGYAAMAEIVKGWHDDGITPREVWLGSGGQYTPAEEFFKNEQTVMYFSGSWLVGNFAETISDFDWVVVPNPTGPGGSTGVAGGAGIVAFDQTENPEEVAAVMEYLMQPDVYAEFAGRTLFIPAHAGAIEHGIEFDTDDEAVANALSVFADEAAKLQDQALLLNLHPFAFAYYDASNTRLAQYFAGELELDEALERLQEDMDEAVANVESG